MRSRWALAIAIAAAAALLPFVQGIAIGNVLYFRDLATLFYPWRLYAVEGLRAGAPAYWDPYVHEGVPLIYPPVGYPLDLLQALWPGARSISLSLVLHVPLAAASFVLLARAFGVRPLPAAAGAAVYALGGFVLALLNLYIYVQAAAWAPLVVRGLRAASTGRWRGVAAAAVAIGIAMSTLGVELALQAIVIGWVLGLRPRRPSGLAGAAAASVLGFALAAPVIFVMRANMAAGERAHGYAIDVMLNQSTHPFTLLQAVIANLYGDLSHLPDRWWGSNFFDRGFPYVLSLYLGATALSVALVGAVVDRCRSRRLVVLVAVALLIALGRWGGLDVLLRALPETLRVFRYPVKAFFTVHLCVAMLVSIGVHALARGRGWRLLAVSLTAFGLPLAVLPLAPRVLASATTWFVGHFFPPALDAATRAANFADLLADGARGGALALAALLVATLVVARRVAPRLGAGLVAAIVAADLLRAGAGLNPMMDAAALRPSPSVVATLRALPGLQRVYSCHPEASRAYWMARRSRPRDHESLTLEAWADTLTPHFNRPVRVPSALGEDLTSLVPLNRLLPPAAGCGDMDRLVPWLRGAGVSHVLSLDPIAGPGLQPVAEIAVPRMAPLHVFVAAVSEPVPLRFVASSVRPGAPPAGAVASAERAWVEGAPEEVDGARGSVHSLREEPDHIELEVEATRPTALVVLDGDFPGWRATVNGEPAPVLPAGTHRAVWVPAGRSLVQMRYRPRGLRSGLVVSALAAAALMGIALRSRAVRARPPAQPGGGPAGGDRRVPSDSSTTWKTNSGL